MTTNLSFLWLFLFLLNYSIKCEEIGDTEDWENDNEDWGVAEIEFENFAHSTDQQPSKHVHDCPESVLLRDMENYEFVFVYFSDYVRCILFFCVCLLHSTQEKIFNNVLFVN